MYIIAFASISSEHSMPLCIGWILATKADAIEERMKTISWKWNPPIAQLQEIK
jgi:hypothetical protein